MSQAGRDIKGTIISIKTIITASITLCFFFCSVSFAQSILDMNEKAKVPDFLRENKKGPAKPVENKAFKKGEVLEYRVHYGFVDAGYARIEVKNEDRKIGGQNVFHTIGTGKTHWAFDWFFRVRDRYESYIDEDGLYPWLFVRRVDEGGYIINQDYSFLWNKDTVDNGAGKRFPIPPRTQDMLSSFYYARTLDLGQAKDGDIFSVQAFIDDSVWTGKLKYIGMDTIEIGLGKFSCLKFVPIVQKGRIFKKEEDLTLYISNDKNKIPILAEAKILVGSIKMELMNYSGIANPISKIE